MLQMKNQWQAQYTLAEWLAGIVEAPHPSNYIVIMNLIIADYNF